MHNNFQSVRSNKRHQRPAPEPEYAHFPCRATWRERRERHLPLWQQVCDECRVIWPCQPWLHDSAAAEAELRWYWREQFPTFGHAANLVSPAA